MQLEIKLQTRCVLLTVKVLTSTPENPETPHRYVTEFRAAVHKCTRVGARRKGHGLTFRSAAYGVVSKASSALFEVGTGRASVSGGNRHLATPLCAANSA